MRRRWPLAVLAGGAAAYVAGSYAASRSLARRLISPAGLSPATTRRTDLLAGLSESGAHVHDLRFAGAVESPVELAAIFATPPETTRDGGSGRGTIVFLHGKGGNAAEWAPDAARAISQGYSVLVPDLRGHPPSAGDFVTYGLLEKKDLALAVAAAERFGIDRSRIAVHSCSAGSSIALAWAAENPNIRALWLESPFADAGEMARHYLSLATGLPAWMLGLTTELAVARARATIRRSLGLSRGAPGSESLDPLEAVAAIHAPVCLVFGEQDELVPPRFTRQLAGILPPGSRVWNPHGAGHCHHDDEPAKTAAAEYLERWTEFFDRALPREV